jgi:DNA-binding response OmpR family regulator
MDHVLVVDDDQQMRHYLRVLLEERGYQVAEAANGKEAMVYIREEMVNLVVSDVVMPDMDGFELIREVNKFQPAVKIMAISGAGYWETPDFYLNIAGYLGADAVLMKPFGPSRFIDKVSALIGH